MTCQASANTLSAHEQKLAELEEKAGIQQKEAEEEKEQNCLAL